VGVVPVAPAVGELVTIDVGDDVGTAVGDAVRDAVGDDVGAAEGAAVEGLGPPMQSFHPALVTRRRKVCDNTYRN
jgi:hypothetical protein